MVRFYRHPKHSSTFHKFSGPKQQLISTKSTEKPSQSTEKPSEKAQNLIAIVLSLPHRDEDNIRVRYWGHTKLKFWGTDPTDPIFYETKKIMGSFLVMILFWCAVITFSIFCCWKCQKTSSSILYASSALGFRWCSACRLKWPQIWPSSNSRSQKHERSRVCDYFASLTFWTYMYIQ